MQGSVNVVYELPAYSERLVLQDAFILKDAMRKVPATIWCRSLLRSSGHFGSDADVRAWSQDVGSEAEEPYH